MLYKAVLNGSAQGQDIKNILYYRTGLGIDISGLTIGGTVELANGIHAMVVPSLLDCLVADYQLEDITVYAYDESTFNLFYQVPYTLGVYQNGNRGGDTDGHAQCGILRFDLEPSVVLIDGPRPPRRGYLAIGPLPSDWITNAGVLDRTGSNGTKLDALTAAVSSNVETLIPPALFFPVRVHTDKVLGIVKIASFADIQNATWRPQTSFRRSRVAG